MVLTRASIAQDIRDVLEYSTRSPLPEFLLNTVLDVMAQALIRGESVKISGFGIFRLRTRRPYQTTLMFMYKRRPGPRVTVKVKPKAYVHFKPSKVLLQLINQEP